MQTEAGNFSGTVIHPAILVLLIVSCILIIFKNNRHSIFLMIFLSIMIPIGQRIEIFSLNFQLFRVLILAGWIKVIFQENLKLKKLEKIDKVLILWVIISFIVYIIHQNSIDAVKNRLGFAYDAIGVYFLYRILINSKEDINTICNALAIVSAIIAVCMFVEQLTGKNWFYIFGGVHQFDPIRMGRIRSQGPFAHSINAGVFGAIMFPLYFSMWRHKWGSAFWGIIGTLSAFVLVITSSSMTPIVAIFSGFVALSFWPLQKSMRIIRYCIIFTAVFLQIIMISPLWILIKDVAFIKGSSGLHRFELVNNLIKHFDDWYLTGYSSPGVWGHKMGDLANQYYLEAMTGGVFKLALFIIIIVHGFSIIGKTINIIKDASSQKELWALGSSFFINVVAFFGISYWDQMIFVWYLLLALITSTCSIYGGMHLNYNDMSKQWRNVQKNHGHIQESVRN
jgi:hypothetical protein